MTTAQGLKRAISGRTSKPLAQFSAERSYQRTQGSGCNNFEKNVHRGAIADDDAGARGVGIADIDLL